MSRWMLKLSERCLPLCWRVALEEETFAPVIDESSEHGLINHSGVTQGAAQREHDMQANAQKVAWSTARRSSEHRFAHLSVGEKSAFCSRIAFFLSRF